MKPPGKKNQFRKTPTPLLPPSSRSRAALGLSASAAIGRFALQVCDACQTVQYPPRDVCRACLSTDLVRRDVPDGGEVIAETTIHISADNYFRAHGPWRVGTVALDCGPFVVAHLDGAVRHGSRVKMAIKLDKGGQGVMVALPANAASDPHDRQMREMTCDPKHRRVLVTDARSPFGQAVAHAMVEAGAQVFAGLADPWKPVAGGHSLDRPGIERIELDVTDGESVRRAVGAYGGRVEIVVNTALHIRPGGILDRVNVAVAREEMEVAYFGAMRLAQAFGPALRARGADGSHSACAWVDIISVNALAPSPGFGALGAAHSGALGVSRALRSELRGGGIRVMNMFVGPLDDEWHAEIPSPKVSPGALAAAIVRALRDGVEDVAVGDVAQDIFARWRDDPIILARELSAR